MTSPPSQHIAAPAGPRTIALYWGSGTYPGDLYDRLKSVTGLSIHVLSPLDIPAGRCTSPMHRTVNFSDIQSVLEEHDIKEILFAGGFSFGELFKMPWDVLFGLFTDAVTWRLVIKTGFFSPGRLFLTGAAFYRALQYALEECGVTPLSPHDLVGDFKGVDGQNGGRYGNFEIETYENVLRDDLTHRRGAITITQSYIVSNQKIILHERFGTKKLLHKFMREGGDKHDPLAALVKLPAGGFNVRLEMPFIGPDTIRQCREAGVREIVFCTDYTVYYQKEEIRRLADEKPEIAIRGMTTDALKSIFKDDADYLAGL